jgi:N-acetylglucosaminyldiphosphoundecaprenol N-acetyl-beta-D-mannosaminyltransferase
MTALAPVRPAPPAPRVDVLGVGVSAISTAGAVETMLGWIERGERHYVCVTGVHGVMESRRDPALRAIHNRSGLTVADGAPLYWMCRLAGCRHATQSRGADLYAAFSAAAAERGLRYFFYGGGPGVAEAMAARTLERFPGVRVAGTLTPPFRPLGPDEADAVVAAIDAASPDVVWVGLSTPKQERFMAAVRPRLAAPVLVGVGAVFDFFTGAKREAPPALRGSGLEWLFRLACEPRRLWRRYLVNNTAFAVALAAQLARSGLPRPG